MASDKPSVEIAKTMSDEPTGLPNAAGHAARMHAYGGGRGFYGYSGRVPWPAARAAGGTGLAVAILLGGLYGVGSPILHDALIEGWHNLPLSAGAVRFGIPVLIAIWLGEWILFGAVPALIVVKVLERYRARRPSVAVWLSITGVTAAFAIYVVLLARRHPPADASFGWIRAGELIVVVMAVLPISWSASRANLYCEACDRWAPAGQVVRRTGMMRRDRLRQRLLAGDLSMLRELPLLAVPSVDHLSWTIEACNMCDDLKTLTILAHRYKPKAKESGQPQPRVWVHRLLISAADEVEVRNTQAVAASATGLAQMCACGNPPLWDLVPNPAGQAATEPFGDRARRAGRAAKYLAFAALLLGVAAFFAWLVVKGVSEREWSGATFSFIIALPAIYGVYRLTRRIWRLFTPPRVVYRCRSCGRSTVKVLEH